jgi:hypothetical protein
MAEELWSYGEDSLCRKALQLSDVEMVRVWLLAGGLLLKERARSSGEAASRAAVSVIEGRQRPLARKRRRHQADRLRFDKTPEERYADISRIEESASFREEWG